MPGTGRVHRQRLPPLRHGQFQDGLTVGLRQPLNDFRRVASKHLSHVKVGRDTLLQNLRLGSTAHRKLVGVPWLFVWLMGCQSALCVGSGMYSIRMSQVAHIGRLLFGRGCVSRV
jgi:hypothetical protein